MGTLKFALSMLKKEYKKSLFYGLTLIFAIAVSFVFFNIINNPLLADTTISQGGRTWSQVQVPFSTTLSFMIICFCCFMIFFANNFYLSRKTNEIAILAMSGLGMVQSTLYLLYQTLALMIMAIPFGIGIGQIVIPFANEYMYQYLNITASIYDIPQEAYIYSILLVAIMLGMLSVLVAGYIYRNDIQTLLSQEKEMDFHDKRRHKFPSVLFGVVYLLGIAMMFMQEHSGIAYITPTLVGIVGAVGMIKFYLPDLVRKLKKGPLLTKRHALIYVSNLSYSIKRSILLFGILTASVTGMLAVLASNQDQPREFATAVIGYVVIIVLLVTSIVYKLSMEAQTRQTLFVNLWKIGYTKKELKKIVKNEVILYYVILLLIPMIYVVFIAGRFIYYQEMSISFALVIILSYMIPIILSALVTYYQYIASVVRPIKEGK